MTNEIKKINQNTLETKLLSSAILDSALQNKNKEKYIKSVVFEIRKKGLENCDIASIITSIKTACDLGLEIDSRQHCHLIQYGNQAQLQVGYQGYIYTLKKHFPNLDIKVGIVKKGDLFEVKKFNNNDEFKHEIKNPFGKKEDIEGIYCYISNGNLSNITLMSLDEINKIKSKAKTQTIWAEWYEQMAIKAIIKRACKINFAGIVDNLNEVDNEDFDLEKKEEKQIKVINDLPDDPAPVIEQAVNIPVKTPLTDEQKEAIWNEDDNLKRANNGE